MTDQDPISFPQYSPPQPSTDKVDFAERKQSNILWKALKQLTRPKTKVKTTHQRNWKKRLKYY